MNIWSRSVALMSYLVLVCAGGPGSAGCGAAGHSEDPASSSVAIEVRLQDDSVAGQSAGVRGAGARSAGTRDASGIPGISLAGPAKFDDVVRILIDVSRADTGDLFYSNLDLTKLASNVWHGDVPALPRNLQLHFVAHALDNTGAVAFSGETLATLAIDNSDVSIPLAPVQNGATFQLPRLFQITYPAHIITGQQEQFAFTIQSNAGQTIGIQISPLGSPGTPSPDFSPATGSVTLTNTVADFIAVYTAPTVTTETSIGYQVTLTSASSLSAVSIATNFQASIILRPNDTDTVVDTSPSVLFNPVIQSVLANGSEVPDAIELSATVSDDSAPDQLSYQWSFTPNMSTPDATFASDGKGNPALFQGYTVAHQGTITLAVTDEHSGTTTLHYQLAPGQFADAIEHGPVNGLRRIVSGDAHTCVLTGDNRVRCWGDNQFGQLGYGNTTDIGDAPSRLPFTAGDVPLPPLDPVIQLVAGSNHTCALLQSGLVSCWGHNNIGQLGYGRTDNIGDGEPVTAAGYVTLGDRATKIAAGGDHTCAIMRSGSLRCWGQNSSGELGRGNVATIGDNETVSSAGDINLGNGVVVQDLALGISHTCALLSTGAIRCWGANAQGQLGYGTNQPLGDNEPINNLANVSLPGPVRKVVAGELHTCALMVNGAVRCWGNNSFDQLGLALGIVNWGDEGGETPSALPSDIPLGAQAVDLVSGRRHICALLSDSKLKCWGANELGELGNGNQVSTTTPQTVNLDGVSVYQLAAGGQHSCALRDNGTARCWGAGADGRLGRGSTANAFTATGNVDIQIFAP